MQPKFVPISNVKSFLSAVEEAKDPGAREAKFALGQGFAGVGKSDTGQWWATQNDGVFLRMKPDMTPRWLLSEWIESLGETPFGRSLENLYTQLIGVLARDPRPLVLDEVEHAMRDMRLLEQVRAVSDMTEIQVVLLGREGTWTKMKRHPQFETRTIARAEFQHVTLGDVRLLCSELSEVKIADDLVKAIFEASNGYVREVVKAIKNVEKAFPPTKHQGRTIDASAMDGKSLTVNLYRGGR